MLYGFEALPKENRENYVVILAATRMVGIVIVSLVFYYLNDWVYFIIINTFLVALFGAFYARHAFESPLQVMVSTGSHDLCKSVLNAMAVINEEDILTEKLAFSYSESQIAKRRTISFLVSSALNHRLKLTTLSILGVCWLGYATAQMVHFVFLDRLELSITADVLILGATEFLAAIFSKVVFKQLTRRNGLLLSYLFVLLCFFFLLIFDNT